MKNLLILLISCMTALSPQILPAQNINPSYPVPGMPVPDFTLTNVHYYSANSFAPKNLTGKWIILDFWSKGCTACVQSFPKINGLQNEFKDQIQFLMIGNNDLYNKGIEKDYSRYKQHLKLNLPIAYDSVIFKQFGIQSLPHVIIIDPDSKVYAVTYSQELTRSRLNDLIENRKPVFSKKYNVFESLPANQKEWNYFLTKEERVKEGFLYRSILSKSEGEPRYGDFQIDDKVIAEGVFQVTSISLSKLYNIAYTGLYNFEILNGERYWPEPLIETQDSNFFKADYTNNESIYNYSLAIPTKMSTKANILERIQNDLKNCFGYVVNVERRIMPYWKLTATQEAKKKLYTKDTRQTNTYSGPSGINRTKCPVSDLIMAIKMYNGQELAPFVDETGITGNIDLNVSAVMTDLNDIRRALKMSGLILEKSRMDMKVIVIRDTPATQPK